MSVPTSEECFCDIKMSNVGIAKYLSYYIGSRYLGVDLTSDSISLRELERNRCILHSQHAISCSFEIASP